MSNEVDIKDAVDAILNPKSEYSDFSLKQEKLTEGSVIVDDAITEISIIDLKGKHFKFPGSFSMTREGSKITFKATK